MDRADPVSPYNLLVLDRVFRNRSGVQARLIGGPSGLGAGRLCHDPGGFGRADNPQSLAERVHTSVRILGFGTLPALGDFECFIDAFCPDPHPDQHDRTDPVPDFMLMGPDFFTS